MAYHHGDLPAALLRAAVEETNESGLAALSLRRVAARAGVSHTAAAHHFGDKAGLLTALAVDGYTLLADALRPAGDDTLAMGLAYVRFSTEHPAHFAVMFRPDLLHPDDPALSAARTVTRNLLGAAAGSAPAATAAWAFVHGMATLYAAGNLPARTPDDLLALTRDAARSLATLGHPGSDTP